MLRFNDGISFDTSGELRPEKRQDGWYVVGEGKMLPVGDLAEAYKVIKELEKGRK